MKRTLTTLVAIASVVTCTLFGPVRVQAADGEIGADPRAPFNLSFKGGKPAELIDAIAATSGSRPNTLIPTELADLVIPPMELRAVTTFSVFESLNLLWRNTTVWVRNGNPNTSSQMVWILQRSPESRQTRAFYIGHLLKKFKVDDITTAVRSTWDLSGREPKADLKYHQDTQLLLALGRPDQLNAMTEVLDQLKLAVEPASTNAPVSARKNP